MSSSRNRQTAERWLKTAQEDVRVAEKLMEEEFFSHACFAAQQAGEKAIKALWFLADQEPSGHSLQRLLLDFSAKDGLPDFPKWIEAAAALDKLYIPTRYPNGLPDLTPAESFFRAEAETGIALAKFLLENITHQFESQGS